MRENWFVFQKDRHLGPFSKEEVLALASKTNETKDLMVWRFGDNNWTSISDCSDFFYTDLIDDKELNELPELPIALEGNNSLPPVPAEFSNSNLLKDNISPQDLDSCEIIKEVESKLIKNSPDENWPDELPPLPEFTESGEVTSELEVNDNIERNIIGLENNSKVKMLWLFIIFSVILFSVIYFSNFTKKTDITSELSTSKRMDLIATMNAPKDISTVASFVIGKDRSIYIAINIKNTSNLHMKLSSISNRVLGNEKISFHSKATLKDGLVKLSSFAIDVGNKITDGYYRVELFGSKIDLMTKLVIYLKRYDLFRRFSYVKNYKRKFSYSGVLLYSLDGEGKFNKKLNLYNENVKRKKINLYRDISQKYKTYISILTKAEKRYISEIGKIKRGKSISNFNWYYAKRLAPVFEGITIENSKLHVSSLNDKPYFVPEYGDLLDYAKKIGIFISTAVDNTRKFRKITKTVRSELISEFNSQFILVKNEGELLLRHSQNKMKNLFSNRKSL